MLIKGYVSSNFITGPTFSPETFCIKTTSLIPYGIKRQTLKKNTTQKEVSHLTPTDTNIELFNLN